MFDARSGLVSALTTANFDNVDSYHDFKFTVKADEDIRAGKFQVASAVIGVGDWRVVSRERKHWGKNIVRSEIDILLYFRSSAHFTDYTIDDDLSAALSKSELGSGDTLICELKEADEIVRVHENIFKRRWTLELTALETITS